MDNLRQRSRALTLALALLLIISEAACAQAQTIPTPTPVLKLTPYWTATPGEGLSPDQTETPRPHLRTATAPPTPTPTPFTYKVKKGDTMLAIAFQHGISLDELQAANPDVDPRLLSIGTLLVIPIQSAGEAAQLATPTPLAVSLSAPDCYPVIDGSLWCFAALYNDRQQGLENLSARLSLYSQAGEPLTNTVAIPPLNLIPPGATLPLVAFFPAPVPPGANADAELLTSLAVPAKDPRYMETEVRVEREEIGQDGLQATVNGRVSLRMRPTPTTSLTGTPSPTAPPSPTASLSPTGGPAMLALDPDQVWLAAVAYGSQGEVVGVRKMDLKRGSSLEESLSFEMTVFSLGPPIKRVEVFAEARR